MTEYKQYVEAVNKIFEYITVMKQDWPNPDNVSYIENIEQYKQFSSYSISDLKVFNGYSICSLIILLKFLQFLHFKLQSNVIGISKCNSLLSNNCFLKLFIL